MKSMPYAVSAAYVRKHFNETTRHDVTALIDRLKGVLVTYIDESDWLDDEARSSWKSKMIGLTLSIGYPAWILNDTALGIIEDYRPVSLLFDSLLSIHLR
jgi:predicted metalloendopeptidase